MKFAAHEKNGLRNGKMVAPDVSVCEESKKSWRRILLENWY